MSTLEFVSSIKWPVTVLLLAALATVLLKRNPGTRRSMAAWLERRNLRVHLAGQEIEATLAETQGSMDLAAGNDLELAAAVGESGISDSEPTLQEPSAEAVEGARRVAVERVLRNAVRLGWQWASSGNGLGLPVVEVDWTENGHPTVTLKHDPILASHTRSQRLDEVTNQFVRLLQAHPEAVRQLNQAQRENLIQDVRRHIAHSHADGDSDRP